MINKELKTLYEGYGYKRFKMSKFEPYELYVENKDFLNTNQIITFTDLDGELLALKPDVTLSIMKSGVGRGRIYYNENIYRPKDRHFKEIKQSGIEYIGKLTTYAEAEVIALAAKSLKIFGNDIKIRLSDLSILAEIFNSLALPELTGSRIFQLFESKNVAGLDILVNEGRLDSKAEERLKEILNLYLPLEEGVNVLESKGFIENATHIKELVKALKAFNVLENIYLDFSLINSMDYYNGIIFQGAVSGIPFTVLSGGRYDKLAEKMGKEVGAVGFALDLSLIENYKEERDKYDVDYLIIFDEAEDEITKAVNKVEELIEKGYRVQLAEKSEEEMAKRIRAKEVLELRRMI